MKLQVSLVLAAFFAVVPVFGQSPNPSSAPAIMDQETLRNLLNRLAADESRLQELEARLNGQATAQPAPATVSTQTLSAATSISQSAPVTAPAALPSPVPAAPSSSGDMDMSGGHTMELPGGGPTLKIQGFLDFDFGLGSNSNPLIFPNGATPHSNFQVGEFDLMTSSQLSDKLSFMGEIVFGSDSSNEIGIDIERYLLDYRFSKYFDVGAGRYHTAIGYYSTAFHHGTWFQTATGRPFMYFFEDSGGILPVHNVGATATGLVPGTENNIGLHWIAEIGNGRSSDRIAAPVQNFYSDRTHKSLNLAAYMTPSWVRGLQIGAGYYRDRLTPPGLTPVDQSIGSFYAVYITPTWEFMNEGVLLSNHVENGGRSFNTPLAYSQISRKFGAWRPYLRYQYVNSPASDPVNIFTGKYAGPSLGLRYDFADYACFKLQYNRLDQRAPLTPGNGLDAQVAFTF